MRRAPMKIVYCVRRERCERAMSIRNVKNEKKKNKIEIGNNSKHIFAGIDRIQWKIFRQVSYTPSSIILPHRTVSHSFVLCLFPSLSFVLPPSLSLFVRSFSLSSPFSLSLCVSSSSSCCIQLDQYFSDIFALATA